MTQPESGSSLMLAAWRGRRRPAGELRLDGPSRPVLFFGFARRGRGRATDRRARPVTSLRRWQAGPTGCRAAGCGPCIGRQSAAALTDYVNAVLQTCTEFTVRPFRRLVGASQLAVWPPATQERCAFLGRRGGVVVTTFAGAGSMRTPGNTPRSVRLQRSSRSSLSAVFGPCLAVWRQRSTHPCRYFGAAGPGFPLRCIHAAMIWAKTMPCYPNSIKFG